MRINQLIKGILPIMIFVLEIYVSLRVIYLKKSHIRINFLDELTKLFFVIYLIILYYLVTRKEFSYQIINLKLFKEIFRYPIFSKLFFKNVLGNIFLFIPYGLFLTYSFKIHKCFQIILLTFLLSITIEIMQIFIGRVFDIDDLLLNLVGGIVGYLVVYMMD